MIDSTLLQEQIREYIEYAQTPTRPNQALTLLEHCCIVIDQLSYRIAIERSRGNRLQSENNLLKEASEQLQQRLTTERTRADRLQDEADLAFEILQQDIDDLR